MIKKKNPQKNEGLIVSGDDLLSHLVAKAVPSAQWVLTTEFGMGSGDHPRNSHREFLLVSIASNRLRKQKIWKSLTIH